MTPADRTLLLSRINEVGYGDDVAEAMADVLETVIADPDIKEVIRLALYHAYWQGRHEAGDEHGEEDA
jgi:hypothetical protein